jgi:hypothetical protein
MFAASFAFAWNAFRNFGGFASDFGNACGFLHFHSVGCFVGFVCHVLSFPMIERSPDYTTVGALWLHFFQSF